MTSINQSFPAAVHYVPCRGSCILFLTHGLTGRVLACMQTALKTLFQRTTQLVYRGCPSLALHTHFNWQSTTVSLPIWCASSRHERAATQAETNATSRAPSCAVVQNMLEEFQRGRFCQIPCVCILCAMWQIKMILILISDSDSEKCR